MGIVFWILLVLFGWLFGGWEFFLYIIIGFILFFLIQCFYPKWFDNYFC